MQGTVQGFIQDFRFGGETQHLGGLGASISNVDFNEILDIFKQKNRRILL